jgi:hypothetical protein
MRIGIGVAAVGVALLAGCAPAPVPGETAPPPPSATSTPTTVATPAAPVFELPAACAGILSPETAAAFEAAGRELLGGPDGVYGENYFGDPTPEEQAGGITCVWGDEDDTASTVIVSVAPVTTATRSGIIGTLIDSGLVESEIEGGLTYARIGDEVSAPAELHVIRTESWISVIEALGGETRFEEAGELVDEVSARVYVAG